MLLDRAIKVIEEPFPHVIIEEALDRKYYSELSKHRPLPETIIAGRSYGPNQRIDMETHDAMERLHPIWKKFCSYHVSIDFLNKVYEVFGEHIKRLYPEVQSVGMRCQPGLNTPCEVESKVRGPHLDNPAELYAGLFYMASDSDGGNLELYRWKKVGFYGKLEVPEDCVELVKTVFYRPNTYVMFLNSRDSLHGVSPRRSKHFRRMVNIVGDADRKLFSIDRD